MNENLDLSLAVGALYIPIAVAGNPRDDTGEGAVTAAQSAGSTEDEQAIRQVISAVFEAANRRDAKAGSLLFTRDADFVNVLGLWWKGAAEIDTPIFPKCLGMGAIPICLGVS